MEIRIAKKEDLGQLINILEQISQIHYESRPDIFKKKSKMQVKEDAIGIMNDKDKKVLVAIDNTSKIYGVLIYKIKEVKNHINLKESKILWIDELGVDEKYRGKGIGRCLMEEASIISKKLNCQRIELNCWDFNKKAISFYEKFGMSLQRRIMEKEI